MYPPRLVPQQPMLRPSRYPHNQALGGHQPSPLLHPRKLRSPCATEIPVLQLPQCCQHCGVHAAAGFICWGQRYRQSGSPTQTGSQKVTQGQVGIQTHKAPRHQPDPCFGVRSQAVAPKAPPKKGNSGLSRLDSRKARPRHTAGSWDFTLG